MQWASGDKTNIANAKEAQTETPASPDPAAGRSAHRQNERIRVLLVDDHMLVRVGLRCILEDYPDIEVVGEATDGKESVDFAERLHPAVIVMDLNMPNMNGIEATALIKAHYPDIIVLGISINVDQDNRTAMTAAGASALLKKEVASDELYDTIRQLAVKS